MFCNIFFYFLPFGDNGNQRNCEISINFLWWIEDFFRNISVKVLSEYLQ